MKLYSDAECTNEIGTDATETLTVYAKGVSKGSATVTATSVADETKTATCTVTVSKKAPSVGDFTYTAPNQGFPTYDGTAKTATVVSKDGVNGMGTVTVHYYSDAGCTDEVQSPTDVGTYYVGITAEEGTSYSAVSGVLHGEGWKFTIGKADPAVNAPTAKSLTYTGSAQELVTAGEASGGEMQYALGTDATNAPTSGYEASIPTATDAGTYYVWYMVKGDSGHSDVAAKSLVVSIANKDISSAKVTLSNTSFMYDNSEKM